MSILRSSEGGCIDAGIAKQERCKPDYEGMIASQKDQKRRAQNLMDAIYDFIGFRSLDGKLAEMIGELHSNIRCIDKRTEELMKAMEEE